jgi:hypothetical protein
MIKRNKEKKQEIKNKKRKKLKKTAPLSCCLQRHGHFVAEATYKIHARHGSMRGFVHDLYDHQEQLGLGASGGPLIPFDIWRRLKKLKSVLQGKIE